MALYAKSTQSDFTPAPEGQYAAICVDVVDRGLQDTAFGSKHKIRIAWLINEIHPETGKPFIIMQQYTLSSHEKSNLGQLIDAWRGKPLSKDERAEFDVEALIGVPALLSVVHRESGDQVYANVGSIMPLPAAMAGEAPGVGDYIRHIDREEYSKDVRNPRSEDYQPQSSVSDSEPKPYAQAQAQANMNEAPASYADADLPF